MTTPPERRFLARTLGRAIRMLLRVALVIVIGLGAGFLWFAATLNGNRPPEPRADAIIALTGGEERIDVALSLLTNGSGGRLLISGVGSTVTADDIAERTGRSRSWFDCCVDLGWSARDTKGNALEAAAWIRTYGYRKVLVVTAHYHMPRALLELSAAVPDVELIPYPVSPHGVRLDAWWSDPATFKVLAGEYLKFIASLARLGAGRALG